MMKRFSQKKRGFTLIELMVSVAIFAIIMVISLGALLSIAAANRKAETIASVMNNLNFAVESMTRTIRTGYDYHCGTPTSGDCGTGGSAGGTYFAFTAQDGTKVAYCLNGTTAEREVVPSTGTLDTSCSASGFLPITSSEVVLSNLSFYLRGSSLGSTGDNIQPNVVITVTGSIQISNAQKTPFTLQTSVTQRLYDR